MCQYNATCTQNCTTTCVQSGCGCLSRYSAECIIYDGEELTCTNIAVGLNLNDLIQQIDAYFCIFRDEINNFITILNLGAGAQVYRDDNLQGQKQLRSLISADGSLVINELTDEIEFDVQSATEDLEGVIEIATQTEVDAGTDTNKAVTPSTLTTYVSDPANLPVATEISQGIAEIATQAEVDTGTDDERFVTPLKLATFVQNPVNLPIASETLQGIAEIATQAEVDAGTDDERIVTPAKLGTFVSNELSNPGNLPNATETSRGIAEIATQVEVDAGVDDERFVTPLKLGSFVNTTISNPANLPNATEVARGIAEIATQAEVDAGTDDERFVTPLKLQNKLGGGTLTMFEEYTIAVWSRYQPITQAHTLGVVPRIVEFCLRCTSAFNDYAVGDEVEIDYHFQVRPDSPQAFGIGVVKNSANIRFKVGNEFSVPFNFATVTGDAARVDLVDQTSNGNFEIVIRLFA